jgi:hypothetical protein
MQDDVPLRPPPSGAQSNFESPRTLVPAIVGSTMAIVGVMLPCVVLRLLVKRRFMRSFWWDDCEFVPLVPVYTCSALFLLKRRSWSCPLYLFEKYSDVYLNGQCYVCDGLTSSPCRHLHTRNGESRRVRVRAQLSRAISWRLETSFSLDGRALTVDDADRICDIYNHDIMQYVSIVGYLTTFCEC